MQDDTTNDKQITVTKDDSSVALATLGEPALNKRHFFVMAQGGLLFLMGGLSALGVAVFMLLRRENMGLGFASASASSIDLIERYASLYLGPLIVALIGFFCFGMGVMLLRAAGASGKEVIPREDFKLLAELLIQEKTKGIDEYIRLRSLTGITGFFTRLGFSGLPLATLAITMIFSIMSIWNKEVLEFAKLSLGAFLGSYVTKSADTKKS